MTGIRKFALAALLGLLALPVPAMAGITAQDWGVTADDGRPAKLFTLTNANGMEARITNYGGVVVSLTAPDRSGHLADVVEGFGSLTDYTSADYLKSNGHYGAIVGRFANRIRGATITLDGKSYALDPDKDGNLDQGGTMAYFRQVFDARAKDGPEPSLVLTRTDPDGFMGFPGKVEVTITYTLTRTNALAGGHARHHRQEDSDQPDQPFLFQAVGGADHGWARACRSSPTNSRPSMPAASRPAKSATWRAAISISPRRAAGPAPVIPGARRQEGPGP